MKHSRITRIALVLGVSLLALSLFAGVALAAGGAKNQGQDRTKSQVCDGSCKATNAGSANGVQARTQTKAQDKTQTRSQLRDGTCPSASCAATGTKSQTRDQTRSKVCDGSCKTK